jgi:hypothetical protein
VCGCSTNRSRTISGQTPGFKPGLDLAVWLSTNHTLNRLTNVTWAFLFSPSHTRLVCCLYRQELPHARRPPRWSLRVRRRENRLGAFGAPHTTRMHIQGMHSHSVLEGARHSGNAKVRSLRITHTTSHPACCTSSQYHIAGPPARRSLHRGRRRWGMLLLSEVGDLPRVARSSLPSAPAITADDAQKPRGTRDAP